MDDLGVESLKILELAENWESVLYVSKENQAEKHQVLQRTGT